MDDTDVESPKRRTTARDRWHSPSFEAEARERMTALETKQDALQRQAEDLRDGQKEILDTLLSLSDDYVSEDEFEGVAEKTESNTKARHRATILVKASTVVLTLLGGMSGYVIFIG